MHGSDWFSRVLGGAVQLVFMPDDARRPVEREYARADDIVSFADGFPLLVVNRASLRRRSATRVDVRRFRPNLVVSRRRRVGRRRLARARRRRR